MAEIDASIPLNAGASKPINPLETLGQVAGVAGQMNQNALFRQQFRAKQATSQIYQRNIKPDGTLDYQGFQRDVASDPSLALGAGEAFSGAADLRQKQANIDQTELANAQTHLKTMGTTLGSLIADPTPLTPEKVVNLGITMYGQKLLTQQQLLDEKGVLDQVAAQAGGDPKKMDQLLRSHILQMVLRANDAATQLTAMAPAPTMLHTGGGSVPVRLPQIGPAAQAGPGIPDTLPATTPVPNGTGAPTYLGGAFGADQSAPPPSGGQAPGSAPGGMPAPPSGRPGGVPAGLAPGEHTLAEAQVPAAMALATANSNIPQQLTLLNNMHAELAGLTTGPGADWIKKGQNWINEFTGGAANPQDAGKLESFIKQAQQLAQQLLPSLGTGTDAKLMSAIATNPSEFLSKNGNERIISLLHGSMDAVAAKNTAWQAARASGANVGDFNKWEADFNKSFDPRVFQWQYASDPQKMEIIKDLGGPKSDGFKKFKDRFNSAAHAGLLPTVNQNGGGQ